MDAQKVDRFIIANKKYFPDDKVMYLKEKLLAAPEDKASLALISAASIKSLGTAT